MTLSLGNVPGAQDVSISSPVEQTTQAVQTRSQAKKVTKGLTPLITPLIDLGTEDIAKLQSEDDTLCRARESAQQGDDPVYQFQRGFLYRIKRNKRGQETKQLALPKGLRRQVMTLAHAGIMSGHQGVHRTQERITASFWWPGITEDVTRFCHSCDVCQRTISKGRVPKVPLGKMPIIEIKKALLGYLAAHRRVVNVLTSNSAFLIFAGLVLCSSHSRPYKMF